MNQDIDYRYLKAYYATAKYLNFSKAADELNIAQSAVSRQIKLLEQSLNEQLIVRSSKKVLLTDKGKALYRAIQMFEDNAQKLLEKDEKQLLKVGILHGLLETWFIQVIKSFIKNSHHELKVEVDNPQNLKKSLMDGYHDVIFTTENIQSDLITSLKLFEEKLVLISKQDIDLKKVHEQAWITYGDDDFFFDLYKKHSEQIITVSSITSMITLVKEGVGVAIVPTHTIKKEDKLKTYEIKGVKRPLIYISTLSYQSLPDHVKQLVEISKANKNL